MLQEVQDITVQPVSAVPTEETPIVTEAALQTNGTQTSMYWQAIHMCYV